MKVLLTGSNGFVGSRLAPLLKSQGIQTVIVSSNRLATGDTNELDELLSKHSGQIDAIVHLGGRAHVVHDKEDDPKLAFFKANVETTKLLAEFAIRCKIRKFIYISSVKALGERSPADRPLTIEDEPEPEDDYGGTKLEAENTLRYICSKELLQYTILRPPLIVGAGAKGNLDRLTWLVKKGIPLPFAGIKNKRSLVGVRNFCDAILFSLTEASTDNRVFLVSDSSLSTPELFRAFSRALCVRDSLFYFPPGILRLLRFLPGFRGIIDRLCGSLEIDSSPLFELGWNPKVPIQEEMRALCSDRQTGASN
ncbi:NAD(P)H-binding protein, PF13460 family [Leptospira inadai serovar Lyme str. 10]|uniref:NAD(P)H-binding protein, PF13460 family n=2 Tax=Leptospira inadai serovar Lyme TaxID=293084 RepID=V6HVT1_9LEPT|nr:NAD-dependent epimerase/dehydratase family protein [Leptospira inadai]EQA36984.1 NAD(P)H-binding protein, PF13460 family [Leptospira inadai serovar Lyme str. 10]PNV75810.1 UDP-glucose 4-epimerase [Leptospira inadai serovar Lyme]